MDSCRKSQLLALSVCCVLLLGQLCSAQAAPSTGFDYDNLRDLYELLLRNEMGYPATPSRFATHQLERKGGRAPTLRLRFGRRSDPLWANNLKPSSLENLN